MHFSLSTIALVASLLVNDVVAVPHARHMHLHYAKRNPALVTQDVYVTNTVTDWLTIVWDGTKYITPTPTPAANAAETAVNALENNVATNVGGAAELPVPTPTTAAPVAPPTTLATVVAPSTPAAPVVPPAVAVVSPAAPVQPVQNSGGIVGGAADVIGGIVSSVVAPIIPTPQAPVIPTPTPPVIVPPTTGGGSSSGDKRGVAYNNADLVKDFTGSNSKISWAYNWGSNTPTIPSTLEYVPMIWGTGSDHSSGWSAAASAAIAAGSKHLLAFNEPDMSSQSNLDPAAAAAGYMQFMQPFAGQAKLGAPAVTNGGAPMGLTYLQSFLGACSGCTIDFVPIHWYDAASNTDGFKQHVSDMHGAAGGRPLWITEFGAFGSDDEQNAFLQEVIPWLDSTDYVERYAYFYADGALTQNNAISALGNTFMSFVS